MNFLEKIFDNLFVRLVILALLGVVFLYVGGYLFSLNFPTYETNMTISVSERQTACAALNCIYYIITPENKWFQASYDMYPKLPPDHTYDVIIRVPKCDERFYQLSTYCNSTKTIIAFSGVT